MIEHLCVRVSTFAWLGKPTCGSSESGSSRETLPENIGLIVDSQCMVSIFLGQRGRLMTQWDGATYVQHSKQHSKITLVHSIISVPF